MTRFWGSTPKRSEKEKKMAGKIVYCSKCRRIILQGQKCLCGNVEN